MVCAGNEDPLLLGIDGTLTRIRLEGGLPLCTAEFPYPLEKLTLKHGETLVLITDGVTEAQNAEGALFGRDRNPLENGAGSESASAICEQIRDRVRAFENGTEATDDLTVMAVRYL
jgi:sigma-B regulation protein RsbU (phosphoserine phosphatase)